VYELVWTPTEISMLVDGISYGSLVANLRESAMAAKIKSAVNWANNGPFDKEVNAMRPNRFSLSFRFSFFRAEKIKRH